MKSSIQVYGKSNSYEAFPSSFSENVSKLLHAQVLRQDYQTAVNHSLTVIQPIGLSIREQIGIVLGYFWLGFTIVLSYQEMIQTLFTFGKK